MEKDEIKIVILAAGKGVRMESEDPKALLLYKEKPFIEYILDTVSKLKLSTKPVIVVGYKKERVQEVLGNKYEYAEQKEQLGTGHAVGCARNYIDKNIKTILVLCADQPTVSPETLEKMLAKHEEKNATVTIGTVIVPDFEDWRIGMYKHFGRIIRGDDGSVKKIIEFKDTNDDEKNIKELNLSIYAFDSNWLWKNIDNLENKNVQKEFYLTDMVQIACEQQKKIEAVPVSNIIEAIHPNSKVELELLEKLSI